MAISIRTYNEILGDLVRKIIADTPVNDINKGSVLLTLLEAAAASDYENSTAVLSILELLNIDALRNNDLDARAADFGLTRSPAAKASGFVTVSDTAISKRSTTLYPVKSAPIAGSTTLFVNDASEWASSGTLYIGRGTPNFEGPISYSSIADNGSFFSISLSSALENDHLISDSVIDGQGTTDRLIPAGTIVKIPSNNQSPEIGYVSLRDATMPAGEDSVAGVEVIARSAGSFANAGTNTIAQFESLPFSTAAVSNPSAFSNGADIESDESLKERIKSYPSTLARGTKASILSAVIGLSNTTENKQVASAVITEPVDVGDPSIIYVDDGSGFQPSYTGQSVDLIINNASGNEEFLQLANFPIPRPQIVNTADGPYQLEDSAELRVLIDGLEEVVVFNSSDFVNISSATITEVLIAINNKATTFKCRLDQSSNRLLLFPVEHDIETIKISSNISVGQQNSNDIFKFPVNEQSSIKLYKNNTLLRQKEKKAQVISTIFSTWNITADGDIILTVDGTPSQTALFTTADFGGTSFVSLSLSDWVTAFNAKFAGITAEATASQQMLIKSNKDGTESSIEILGGSYFNKLFASQEVEAVGQTADFLLNRQNGALQLLVDAEAGDIVSAGSADTKGAVVSVETTSGTFNVSSDSSSRPAETVFVVDADEVVSRAVTLPIAGQITVTDEGSNVMQILSDSASTFKDVQPLDYVYIAYRGDASDGSGDWFSEKDAGLYQIIAKGDHTSGSNTYIEVKNNDIATSALSSGGTYSVVDANDIQAFKSDKYPQIWRGGSVGNPPAEPIQGIVDSLNENLKNVNASVYRTNFIRVTSTTEDGGSIATPVSIGNANLVFPTKGALQTGNESHVANKVSEKDFVTSFKRTSPSNTDVFLGRHTYNQVKSSLTANAERNIDGSGTEDATLQSTGFFTSDNISYDDALTVTRGPNRFLYRTVQSIENTNEIKIRNNTPRSIMDYITGDEFSMFKMLEFGEQDNIVAIVDDDAIAKTIDVRLFRTGRVNAGSQGTGFVPTNSQFSADDADNEAGIDFGTLSVWGTTANNTNFNDYRAWFRARNWYSTGGIAGGGGKLLVRADRFGPTGEKYRFNIEYPSFAERDALVSHVNTPEYSTVTYTFGSSTERLVGLSGGETFTVTDLGSDNFRYTFSAGDFSTVVAGDVISILSDAGVSADNSGQFSIINSVSASKIIDIYNPDGVATAPGTAEETTITTVADTAGSLDGTYFIIYDSAGSVAFWIDVDDSGTAEPVHGADRSVEITTITTGMSADDVATQVRNFMVADGQWTASAPVSDEIVATDINVGTRIDAFDGAGAEATGFTISTTVQGVEPAVETVVVPTSVKFFPLEGTDTSDIVTTVNESNIISLTEHTAGAITLATREEAGIGTDELAFGHDDDSGSGLNGYISLYDSENWVLSFQNANPNFTLKNNFALTGAAPSIYALDTAPNHDSADNGEFFKLIPVTLDNLQHHMTQKALSQMEIVSDIDIAVDSRRVQIKSTELGSTGSIEIVGGRGNSVDFDIIGTANKVSQGGSDFTEIKVSTFPISLSVGDTVKLTNPSGTERASRLGTNDTFDVVQISDDIFEYRYNDKDTEMSPYVKWTITDISASYSKPAGTVWRWTHDDSGSYVATTSRDVGTVSNAPAMFIADGTAGTTGSNTDLVLEILDSGTASTALSFRLTVADVPAQAHYWTFEDEAGNDFAVWFDVDGAGTVPTGATYTAATNKIEVDILSSDSPNEIMSKVGVALLADVPLQDEFITQQSQGANLDDVAEGDVLTAFDMALAGSAGTRWDHGNLHGEYGDNLVPGYCIVGVDSASNHLDIVNPDGVAMATATPIGDGAILITPTLIIKWNLSHSAKVDISALSVLSGAATVITSGPHKLNVGDTFTLEDNQATPSTNTVDTVLDFNSFTYDTGVSDGAYSGGTIIKSSKTVTTYKIESLGFNDLFRLSSVNGDSPNFADNGIAVDDLMVIQGETFKSNNAGQFRVLAVDNSSIVFENANGEDELHNVKFFNNLSTQVQWTTNSSTVTASAGAFKNLALGDWVKKVEDSDAFYRQVTAFNTGSASTATSITLGSAYPGTTALAEGLVFAQDTAVEQGVDLRDTRDIEFYEADSVRLEDTITISSFVSPTWFNVNNAGVHTITAYGANSGDFRPFLRVTNTTGVAQTNVLISSDENGFNIVEGSGNIFSTTKEVSHMAIDEFDSNKTLLYLTPSGRESKFNETAKTTISSSGKIGTNLDIVKGVDGYLYYTGLMRTIQRTIDGFEPDEETFPGRRAVGGLIEALPPLQQKVTITIRVTTNNGVNINDITNQIKSTIITYIDSLGVGKDVILSTITVRVKSIEGVAAVTFVTPEPDNERISINDNEKAFIEAGNISIA